MLTVNEANVTSSRQDGLVTATDYCSCQGLCYWHDGNTKEFLANDTFAGIERKSHLYKLMVSNHSKAFSFSFSNKKQTPSLNALVLSLRYPTLTLTVLLVHSQVLRHPRPDSLQLLTQLIPYSLLQHVPLRTEH